jgi:hypothetical protein
LQVEFVLRTAKKLIYAVEPLLIVLSGHGVAWLSRWHHDST